MPLAIIPPHVRKLSERWRNRIADRRALSTVDPAADALAAAADELDAAIAKADTEGKTLNTREFAALRKVAPGTVRKWCERGELAGAAKNDAGDWEIPADAVRQRARRSKATAATIEVRE